MTTTEPSGDGDDGRQAEPVGERGTRRADEASSLRGELRSILVLYLLGAVLPLVIGLVFGPESS